MMAAYHARWVGAMVWLQCAYYGVYVCVCVCNADKGGRSSVGRTNGTERYWAQPFLIGGLQ